MSTAATASSTAVADGTPSHRLPSDRDTNTPFWNEGLPPDLPEDTKRLFIEYSKIPEDKLEEHLLEARKTAWESCPYPCVGLWLFIKLQLRSNKEFDEAVRRTQQGHKLLDFGCALGQDLRSLAHAGAPTTNLFGADLVEKFFDAGFTLFKDAHSGITFRQADALDADALSEWHGHFSVITCNYVQHCFSIEDQESLAAVILRLLSGGPGDLFFGRTGGTRREARREVIHGGQRFYRHSESSFAGFWTRMAARFGRTARVETRIDDAPAFELKGEAKEKFEPVYNLMFAIRFE